MRRRIFMSFITVLFAFFFTGTALASTADFSKEKRLTIANIDSRPIYIDRLIYTAFNDIGYSSVFIVDTPQVGFDMVNRGERDGVITPHPNFQQLYPELLKVPFVIDTTDNVAFVRDESGLAINEWSDLSGLTVGILTDRTYIPTQIPKDSEMITRETPVLILDALARGECDVVILALRSHEILSLPAGIKKSGVPDVLFEYLYLNSKYEYLLPEITKSLQALFADGRGDKILDNEFDPENRQKRTVLHIYSANSELTREEQFRTEIRNRFKDDPLVEWYTVIL